MPTWRRALAQLQDPLVYLLGAAAAVALAAWWFEGRGHQGVAGWPLDAIVTATGMQTKMGGIATLPAR